MTPSMREAQTLAFIRVHLRDFGRAPFQHEIAAHLGTRSRGFVSRMISRLEAKGLIARKARIPGSIVLHDVPATPLLPYLDRGARSIVERVAAAEQTTPAVIMAQWISERAAYEAEAKAREA